MAPTFLPLCLPVPTLCMEVHARLYQPLPASMQVGGGGRGDRKNACYSSPSLYHTAQKNSSNILATHNGHLQRLNSRLFVKLYIFARYTKENINIRVSLSTLSVCLSLPQEPAVISKLTMRREVGIGE
jgi:hypothetical protein